MPGRDEERELQELLRLIAGVVMLGLFALIVIVAAFTPREQAPDTTLLLGLAASTAGAGAAYLGVVLAIQRGKNGKGS